MTRLKHLALSTGVAAALSLLSLEASALISVNMPSSGTVYVGMVAGEAWAAFSPSAGGACSWWDVGTAAGLSDDVQVNGSSGSDAMIGVEGTRTMCGWTWGVLVLNGRQLGFKALNGNDTLGWRATWMAGDGGDDYLYGANGVTLTQWGWIGNDKMFAGASATALGEGGNDAICMWAGTTATQANGGADTDTFCGNTPPLFGGFESINPGSCNGPCL
jgi:hypothetical protein